MRLVESKPITSNVTVPAFCHRKFVTIGVNKYYLHYRCSMRYDVIYDPFPINSQYLRTWGVDSLVNLTPIIPQSDSSPQYFVTINCPLVSKHKMTYLAFFNSRFFSFFL